MKKRAVKLCKDCGKPLSQKALRCRECFHKSTRGRSAWNSGKRTHFRVCIDCGEIKYPKHGEELRCRKCANKYMKLNPPCPHPTWLIPWGKKWHLGHKHSEETKKLFSVQRMGKLKGEKNAKWMGDDVGYNGLHSWVSRELGKPYICEMCGKSGLIEHEIHWASISREYKRDVDDWIRLCAKCHYHFDGLGEKRWEGHVKNSDKECTVVGCTNSVKGRGLCNKHYLKEWRTL